MKSIRTLENCSGEMTICLEKLLSEKIFSSKLTACKFKQSNAVKLLKMSSERVFVTSIKFILSILIIVEATSIGRKISKDFFD